MRIVRGQHRQERLHPRGHHLMDAVSFAQWLTNLLAGASPVGDPSIRIFITDDSGKAAEVEFDLEWCWEEVDHVETKHARPKAFTRKAR